MSAMKSMVVEWFDEVLRRKSWTGTDLAKNAGISPSTILRLMNDPKHEFAPSIKTLTKVSQASGFPIPRKILDAMGVSEVALVDPSAPKGGSGLTLKRFSALPAQLRPEPEMMDQILTPPQLDGDRTLFAFNMFNDDLEPAIKSGSLLFATKRRDPLAGDTILLTDKRGQSRVRFLVDVGSNGLTLSRSMPMKKEEQVSFDEIDDLAIITGCLSRI